MAEFVEHDDIILGDNGRNHSERRSISAAETKRCFGSFPFRQRALQAQMRRLRSADQPRRRRRRHQIRRLPQSLPRLIVIVCEAQIIV